MVIDHAAMAQPANSRMAKHSGEVLSNSAWPIEREYVDPVNIDIGQCVIGIVMVPGVIRFLRDQIRGGSPLYGRRVL